LEIPDDIGALAMTANMQSGELKTRTTIDVQDIHKVAALLASLEAMANDDMAPAAADTSSPPTDTIEEPPSPKPEIQNTPAFWMDRGGLLSAYGNYFGAVVSYRKALELSPDLAEAHFQQGVAYGELGRFDAAISAITRAIDLRPSNGAYFYGRARVYLRAGDEDLAMKDFMEAGFLGDDDARAYLKGAGVEWN
jgi:Flp pilus assembly protein TadD